MKKTIFLVLCLWAPSCFADQIRLKDGITQSGEIIAQNETNIVLKSRLPGNITAQKTIRRDDILEIIKDSEDVIAFRKIEASFQISPFSAQPAYYNQIISNQFLPFLTQFPSSALSTNVQAWLNQTIKERDAVADGWMKFNRRWYSPKQIERRKMDFESYGTWIAISQARQTGNSATALNHWEVFENRYFGSSFTPPALDEAILALTDRQTFLAAQIQGAQASQTGYQEARSAAEYQRRKTSYYRDDRPYARNPFADTLGTQKAREQANRDLAKYSAWSDGAKAEIGELSKSQEQVENKLSSLKNLRVTTMGTSISLAESAEAMLDCGMLTKAEKLLREADSNWPQNSLAKILTVELEMAKKDADSKRDPMVRLHADGDLEGAIKRGKEFLENFPGDDLAINLLTDSEKRLADSKEHCEMSLAAFTAGTFQPAADLINKSLAEWPKNTRAHELHEKIMEAMKPKTTPWGRWLAGGFVVLLGLIGLQKLAERFFS